MAKGEIGESSLAAAKPANEKPVIVRVKRKAFQSPLEAFWLEINERPLKRPLLDFGKLSISISSPKEEPKAKKILVRHVETVSSTEASHDILQNFVEPTSDDAVGYKTKIEKRKKLFKETKLDKLLYKAKHEQELLAKSARFEQIWRSRKGNKELIEEELLHKECHLYDVLRVDVQEMSKEVQEPSDSSLEEYMLLHNYLPLMREIIPSAAEEIESDIGACMSTKASTDDYVYDIYAVKEGNDVDGDVDVCPFPLVQVDEDDEFYDGPAESEYESDDSNAEDNPLNDYPDEETSEEAEAESEESANEWEEPEHENVSGSEKSLEPEELEESDLQEQIAIQYEDDDYFDDDGRDTYDYDDDDMKNWT